LHLMRVSFVLCATNTAYSISLNQVQRLGITMSRKHLHSVQTTPTELELPEAELKLLESMISAYQIRRLGSLNHQQRSVSSDTAVIRKFLSFINKAPWNASEDDFDEWCFHIGCEQGVSTSTQRKYQTTVQIFFRYIVDNVKFQADVMDQFGLRIRQIVTDENKIPHVQERELKKDRPPFTRGQFDQLIHAIDTAIIEAYRFGSKSFLPLQRDKVMFYAMYVMGLRNSECCSLNIGSFRENPNIPEFGDFGFASVCGKGSKGSGPKPRTVPIDHPDLARLLQWYADNIRPKYLAKPQCDPNEEAFFITDRGSRMTRGSLISRFNKVIELADLEGLRLCPHSLRHTFTTHSTEAGRSLEYTRRKLGHVYAATTQIYTHCGDEFVNKELSQCAGALIDKYSEDDSEL